MNLRVSGNCVKVHCRAEKVIFQFFFMQARSQDICRGGAIGLFLQWYMVVFITLSMHTLKTNLLTSVFEFLRVTF